MRLDPGPDMPNEDDLPAALLAAAKDAAALATAAARASLVEAGMDPARADQVTVTWDDSPLLPQPGVRRLDLLDHDPTVSP